MKLSLLTLTVGLSLTSTAAFAQSKDSRAVGVRPLEPVAYEAPLRTTRVTSEAKFAILSTKIVTCAEQGDSVINNGVLLVNAGMIEAVGRQGEIVIPQGYEIIDVGDNWVTPGMIDLHSHVGGSLNGNDLNDTVFLTNPGLRASAAVTAGNSNLRRALASGVTSVLYIPGSGSNIGGQGTLIKTGFDNYESTEIRDPGSMKLAQAGNPERFAWGVNRSFMNWHTRETLKRGIAYAQSWEDFAAGTAEKPEVNIQFEIFRWLKPHATQISAHTQMYQVVLQSLMRVIGELKMPLFIDHGTIGAWKLGPLIKEMDVAAAIGPRNVDPPSRGMMNWSQNIEAEGWRGNAVGYQNAGVADIAFNTDAPVMPQEELTLQATIAVRYGFDDSSMQAMRGLTIIPARIAGINHRVGSLEVGKEADILIMTGHPADQRTSIERVWLDGHDVYNAAIHREY